FFDSGVAQTFGVMRRDQVIGDLGLEESDSLGIPTDAILPIDILNAVEALAVERLPGCEWAGLTEQRQFARLADVRKDGIERIVIRSGNGMELVIVAARAGDRHAHHAAGDGREAVL